MKKLALILAVSLSTNLALFAEDDIKASAERGKAIYMQTCMACHQPTGLGIPGAFPPFDGSEFVQGDTKRLVALVIKGARDTDYQHVIRVLDLIQQLGISKMGLATETAQ